MSAPECGYKELERRLRATADNRGQATPSPMTRHALSAAADAISALRARESDLRDALRSMLLALPDHKSDCPGSGVAGAACCFYAEVTRNARAALAKAGE